MYLSVVKKKAASLVHFCICSPSKPKRKNKKRDKGQTAQAQSFRTLCKTGSGSLSGGTLYDHWSADLASTADYYPGGMMMPGRNTEYSWSRFGAQKSAVMYQSCWWQLLQV